MSEAAVVLLSGGMDSTVVLWSALRRYQRVRCLAIDYGQRHRRELRAARRISRLANVHLDLVSIRLPEPETSPSAGTLFLRGRNVLAVAVAAATVGHGSADILVGSLATDPYADGTRGFFDEITRALAGPSPVGQVRVLGPLLALASKSAVAEHGFRDGAPIGMTWSCMQPSGARPCGRCSSCGSRATALAELPGRTGLDSDEIAAWTIRHGSPDHDRPVPPPPSYRGLIDELAHIRGPVPWRRGWRYTGPDGTQRFTPFADPGTRTRRAFGDGREDRFLRVAGPGDGIDPAWELIVLADGTVTRAEGDHDAAARSLATLLAGGHTW